MASLFSKIARFASSPQGRKLMHQAKEFANDPRRQAQAKEALNKLRTRASGNDRTGRTGQVGGPVQPEQAPKPEHGQKPERGGADGGNPTPPV